MRLKRITVVARPDPVEPVRNRTERRYGRLNSITHLLDPVAPDRSSEDGQGLAEYALILSLIAIVAIVALVFLGGSVSTLLSNVGNSV